MVSGGSAYIQNNYIHDNSLDSTQVWCGWNYCSFDGGGIVVTSGEATISANLITNNTAWSSAGGIHAAGGNVTIADNIISENTALDNNLNPTFCGGGIRVSQGSVTVTRNLITKNVTHGKGGIYVTGGVAAT